MLKVFSGSKKQLEIHNLCMRDKLKKIPHSLQAKTERSDVIGSTDTSIISSRKLKLVRDPERDTAILSSYIDEHRDIVANFLSDYGDNLEFAFEARMVTSTDSMNILGARPTDVAGLLDNVNASIPTTLATFTLPLVSAIST